MNLPWPLAPGLQGALPLKLLSLVPTMVGRIQGARRKEAKGLMRMAYIQAANQGMQASTTLLVSFSTFAVYRLVRCVDVRCVRCDV